MLLNLIAAALQPTPVLLFDASCARAPIPRSQESPFPSPDLPEPIHPPVQAVLPTNFQSSAWPVRTMIFIDGTWLYYSIYGQRPECPLRKRFGTDWLYSHRVAFEQLPAMIAQSLHQQLLDNSQAQRFVEVVRTVVFTSARADTHMRSHRMRMFHQMERANFEVHMSTTTGVQEKCVDIALAVEMMHYASVEGAYDCAVLLSGDKDFMPALSRIRQKGKRVALCSMRNCCSRDLIVPSSHVRDFHPIWLDDALDDFVIPNARRSGVASFSVAQLMELIVTYLKSQPLNSASSRNIGRFLQSQPGISAGNNALEDLKESHVGLRAFLYEHPAWFDIRRIEGEQSEFLVVLLDGVQADGDEGEDELIDAKTGTAAALSDSAQVEEDQFDDVDDGNAAGKGQLPVAAQADLDEKQALWLTLQSRTVLELRDELRARGLSHTGRKGDLLERLHGAISASGPSKEGLGQSLNGLHDLGGEENVGEVEYTEEIGGGGDSARVEHMSASDTELITTVTDFLQQSGGWASSRNVGRHLAARGQLQLLKERFSGLFHFLQKHNAHFRIELPADRAGRLEYRVYLLQGTVGASSSAPSSWSQKVDDGDKRVTT